MTGGPSLPGTMHVDVTATLRTHARLQEEGYVLRTLRFDANQRSAGRIVVGLVWRRHYDRRAEVRHVPLSTAQAHELLLGLGGLQAL